MTVDFWVVASALLLCASPACLYRAVRSWRRWRINRGLLALAHVEDADLALAERPASWPRGFPLPEDSEELRSPLRCRAYAQLARERGHVIELLGEVVLLLSGALLGSAVPLLVQGERWGGMAMLVVGLLGGMAAYVQRRQLSDAWRRRAAAYERLSGESRESRDVAAARDR